MITFQEETYVKLVSDTNFSPLLQENWNETGILNDVQQLAPRMKTYEFLADRDLLQLYTVRKKSILIGLFVAALLPHPHYGDVLTAETDTFFISKEHRKGLLGYKFLKYVICHLKQKVQLIFLASNVRRDLSKLLSRLNFRLVEYKYMLEV